MLSWAAIGVQWMIFSQHKWLILQPQLDSCRDWKFSGIWKTANDRKLNIIFINVRVQGKCRQWQSHKIINLNCDAVGRANVYGQAHTSLNRDTSWTMKPKIEYWLMMEKTLRGSENTWKLSTNDTIRLTLQRLSSSNATITAQASRPSGGSRTFCPRQDFQS